ncbi:MAG: FtsW/RodA/SpoVE family cell cycle protein [Candidatus Contendobacter sp.]|nr:FtsW/RodA/SpoVE family cell cycle protein [Candidatus Contendobacter sp.]MDG4555975.1 FtsW/RodA/SpoVE family cell cycle protein [Candidatus Contendobacter sp.]
MPTLTTLSKTLPGLLTILLLLAFGLADWRLLTQAPAERRQVTEVRVTLTGAEQPVILGYQELGQNPATGRSAEKDHLRLRRDAAGGWWASNVADHRKVDAPTEKHQTRYLKRWRLATGDRIRVKTTELEVVEAQGGALILRASGREARWENGRLVTIDPPAAACPNEGPSFWRRWFKRADQEQFLFSLGGGVPCPHRWPLPGVPARGLEVLAWDGAFWLAPGAADARMARAGQPLEQGPSFKNVELRLDDPAEPTKSLFLGRTQYRLRWQENVLTLIPTQKADLWLETDWAEFQARPRDPRVKTETAPTPLPTQFAGLGTWLATHWIGTLIALGLALCAVLVAFRWSGGSNPEFRTLRATVWASALALGTLTALTYQTPEARPTWLLLSLGLAWSGASALLFVTGRLQGAVGWLWVAILGLVGWGSLVQGQLGLGGDNSYWLDFGMGHWRVLALVGWILTPLALVQTATWRRLAVSALDPWTHEFVWLKWAVIGLAVLILAFQFGFGGEEGVWGFRPVEGVKAILVLMLAHAGARLWRWRASDSDEKRRHPIRTSLSILAFILVFVVMTCGLLWAVRDMSPVLLMMLLLLPWLWRIAPHPISNRLSRWAMLGQWGIPLFAVLLLLLLLDIAHAPEQLPHWMPQYDRFMVWADPAHFRESGFQVQRAMELVAASGWSGAAASPFGWNGAVMRLPVVQNDFIGAFLLHRFGMEGGWILLVFQGVFAAALFTLARDVEAWGRNQNAPEKATGLFLALALFAMAWLVLAHWTIAWSNTLGLLPVMGQPMTFVSLANSHHLFFALPGLILGLAAGWMIKPGRDAPNST